MVSFRVTLIHFLVYCGVMSEDFYPLS
jgi:hypothetical protein